MSNKKKKGRKQRASPLTPRRDNAALQNSPLTAALKGNDAMAISTAPVLEHRYNDDLLAQTADREYVARVYPDLLHVLDHPELRAEFARYNALANSAKKCLHIIGLVAISL